MSMDDIDRIHIENAIGRIIERVEQLEKKLEGGNSVPKRETVDLEKPLMDVKEVHNSTSQNSNPSLITSGPLKGCPTSKPLKHSDIRRKPLDNVVSCNFPNCEVEKCGWSGLLEDCPNYKKANEKHSDGCLQFCYCNECLAFPMGLGCPNKPSCNHESHFICSMDSPHECEKPSDGCLQFCYCNECLRVPFPGGLGCPNKLGGKKE